MFKKKQNKGFTIVELVIVIAVIAVLAAVLIPTFAGLIKKAEISNDQTLVRNLNTSLAISSDGSSTKNLTMYETIENMREQGYNVDKLTPTHNKNDILWDSENNQFVLIYEDGTTYTGTTVEVTNDNSKLWKIYKGSDDFSSSKYSIYLSGNDFSNEVTVNAVGFDAGENKNISKVTYKNDTNSAKNIIIRTNSIKTNVVVNGYVDASNSSNGDMINHFGNAGSVEINQCAMESYHEYGKVGYVEIENGHFVAENNSSVRALVATSENVKVDSNNGKISLSYAKSQEIKDNHTGNVELEYIYTSETINSVKSLATFCEEGIGTKDDPFMIGQDTFANIEPINRLLQADVQIPISPIRYYKLTENIDFSEIKHLFTNQQCYIGVDKADIDMNGKVIYNLDIPLIMYKEYINIHNGTINLKDNGSLLINIGELFNWSTLPEPDNIIVKDVVFTGNTSSVQGIIGLCPAKSIVLENVVSYVSVIDNRSAEQISENVVIAGLIGNLYSKASLTLTNCKVYGDITTKGSSASGLINGTNLNMDNITIKNCYYYGKLTTAEGGSKYDIAPEYEG